MTGRNNAGLDKEPQVIQEPEPLDKGECKTRLEKIAQVALETTKEGRKLTSFYPPDFFKLSEDDQKNLAYWRWGLENGSPVKKQRQEVEISRAEAREKYKELGEWNRQLNDRLVEALEPAYCALADRIKTYAFDHQETLRALSSQIPLVEVPYSIASLPPNLFDHCPEGRPFIPQTDEEVIQLVSEFQVYNSRLGRELNIWPLRNLHRQINEERARAIDLMRELQRRRNEGDQTFTTPEGQRAWRRYNRKFKQLAQDPHTHQLSLHENAAFVCYDNNRVFTEEGGFFEKTDGLFESFILADFPLSDSVFTSQIRAPVGWYGARAAADLALATHLTMQRIVKDQQFVRELKAIAHQPCLRTLLHDHLMRSHDRHSPYTSDAVEYGILHTALEGMASVSASSSLLEADGVPGFKHDLWGGITALLDAEVPKMVTAAAPQAVVVPPTLYGNYFRNPLETTSKRLRLRPEVVAKWREIHDKRTAVRHAEWQAHRQSNTSDPPIRLGLHCPFKGAVVQAFAEALTACRAVVHDR